MNMWRLVGDSVTPGQKAGFQYEKNIIHANQPHVLYRIKKDK